MPFTILYVLHTPRGGSDHGRYESPALDRASVASFFRQFGDFIAADNPTEAQRFGTFGGHSG